MLFFGLPLCQHWLHMQGRGSRTGKKPGIMFVRIETTQDPATLRFLPGRAVLESGLVAFDDAEAAEQRSPLAARLFAVAGVRAVALGPDFVAVTRDETGDWQRMKPALLGAVMEHFLTNRPALFPEAENAEAPDHDPADAGTVAEIEAVLETRLRPVLATGDGAIALRRYRDGVAELELSGGVPGMPRFALETRIANTLRHLVPAVSDARFTAPRRAPPPPPTLDRDDAEVAAILDLVETRINPAIASHGGQVALIEVREHVAYIRLEGGCQGCGMAEATLKEGIEVAIRRAVPSIRAVLDVTDHASGTRPYFAPDQQGTSPL